jgi:hypothetical protein
MASAVADRLEGSCRPLVGWIIAAGTVLGPTLAAAVSARSRRSQERRGHVLGLLHDFLDEPMASTRRSAWAFLQREGDDVAHFSHYYLTDPNYGDADHSNGFADLLRVLLFQRTVQDLREAGQLDERLYRVLLEPHRLAWAGYTARMAVRSETDPAALGRGDAGLFTWRS